MGHALDRLLLFVWDHVVEHPGTWDVSYRRGEGTAVLSHAGSQAEGGEPREVLGRAGSPEPRWLGEGNLRDGAGSSLEHLQTFLLRSPPPMADGRYFLGHLPKPSFPDKNEIKMPLCPFIQVHKEPPSHVLSFTGCPPSPWNCFVFCKSSLKQKTSSPSPGAGLG